ncbi:rho GTPase-activating protein 32 isoform X2 [Oryzias latipes]|uniref:Rho GTPase-activating protein 32 n=1 Tax=Oryzias latipes TaxID=8090 RepID=A0A3B3HVW1_ORYLA|nr:rho GTPase-activating protein 32 isoform X2 [Oryzias latipes]
MEAGSGAAAALGLLGAACSHDVLDRSLRPGCHLEDDDIVTELVHIHPRERPDWEETISAMARSAEIPEMRAEPLMRSSSSSTASMKVKNVKKLSFTKGHFPKLAECAHFHYENVDFGTIQLSLGDEQCEVTRNGHESKELVYLVHIYCQGRSWMVKRSYEDFRVLDKHLHLCIYDRRFSQLPELPRLESLTDLPEAVSQMLLAYLSRLSAIADNKINCGPALTWMEVDNKGNHLLVHEESSINVPAIAAAHVIKRYAAQASDELSFEVGDIVSVIDMPPKEDTTWWRGKHGFQVGFFPSECVEVINDKVPQSMTNAVPKADLEMESVMQDSSWVADPLNHYNLSSVSKKHGKLITFLRSFMKSRPSKQKLKQRGILRERVFGCDLGEHLLNSGHDVPQVLKSCTEFIEKHGVVDGIYRLSGIASNIQKLRHEFDSEQIPDLTKDVYIQDIHCVGSLCKLYFRELPNPLLTYQLYEKFSEAVSAATDEERLIKIHDVIQQLPPPHYRTLEFLMRHLSHLAAFSYVTNMHTKNLAIVWAPNLLRSKQIESACFSGTAAFMEVRIQSVVVEFILNHVDVLFSTKLSSLIREGTGHNSLSRPKSLLVSSPSTKLLSLEEAQARTQAQINSPVTEDSKYIEVGEGPAALQGKFHTVIEFPTERKRPPVKSKKSPVGSWRSFFNLGKSSSMSKRKLQRNPSEPTELKAMALAGGRGDTVTLRSAKSEESLSSLHNVEGESKVFRPRRPRSSSDALSASFNGELLDSQQHYNSYDHTDAAEDSDDGPICVPALISPPRSAGEDVDLSPPDIGMASLDFDPMSFQCSGPDSSFAFPADDSPAAEGLPTKRSPGSISSSNVLSAPPLSSRSEGEKTESRRLTSSFSYTEKPTQAVSPIKCSKAPSLTSFALSVPPSSETPDRGPAEPSTSSQLSALRDPPPVAGSLLLKGAEPSLSEAFQVELQAKLAAFESADGRDEDAPPPAASRQEQRGVLPPDSATDPPSCSLSPVAPPPPKNPALMLSLASAESTQLVCSRPRSSEAPPPVSPLQPQEESVPPPISTAAPASFHCPAPSLPVKPEKPSRPAAEPQRQPEAEFTPLNPPAVSTTASRTSPAKTSPESQQTVPGLDLEATPIITGLAPPIPEVRPEDPATPQTLPKLTEPPPQKAKKPALSLPPQQSQAQKQPPPLTHPHPHVLPQPHLSKASARIAPTSADLVEKPWEAIKPVQPSTDAIKRKDPPPAPPMRTMDSKLAAAALSEVSHHRLDEGPPAPHGSEALPHCPLSPRKSSTHPPTYLHHKGEPIFTESAGGAYYHQRAVLKAPQPVPYHYRPESVTPHPCLSRSEPQVPYSTRMDNRYSTLGPRSYHHSIKLRGNPRGGYVSPGPGHQGYSHDRTQGYPTIRRVHSLYAPSTIHSVPIHRTEVPPDDDMFFYHRPGFSCRPYPQPHPQSSQTDYHVTQLQPYFENGRVQYRYSPCYGSSPLEFPYYDIDPYGTIRVRHCHAYGGRDGGAAPGRPGGKTTGYHYLSNYVIPPGKEHSFVSRDIPPSHGSKEASTYHAWDPEEAESLRFHSIRREGRARLKVKGLVLSQYDNVGQLCTPADMSPYDSTHLRSKSDPGKAVLAAAENTEGRYASRHMASDPDVLVYFDTDRHGPGSTAADKSNSLSKSSIPKKCQSSHSVPAFLSHSLPHQQESSRHEARGEARGDRLRGDGRSKYQQEYPSKRNLQPRYEGPESDQQQVKVKTAGHHGTDEAARSKAERSHGPQEDQRYNQTQPDPDRDHTHPKPSSKPVQSHYDNLDEFHPAPHPQAPPQKHAGSFPTPGPPGSLASRAYSTALGQGAFIQGELAMQRPEGEVHTQ